VVWIHINGKAVEFFEQYLKIDYPTTPKDVIFIGEDEFPEIKAYKLYITININNKEDLKNAIKVLKELLKKMGFAYWFQLS